MSTPIGKRNLNLFIGASVELYDPVLATTTTVYWSNRSWITNPNDTIAPNRQYVGLLLQGFDIDYSWFSGDTLGGRSTRNYGTLRAINADGAHSLNYIFEDGLTVQGRVITYYVGEIGQDLGSMIKFTLTGRNIRQSEDGFEVHIDLGDDGQALDSSIFIDKFQGLGGSVRCESEHSIAVPYAASLQPTSAFYVDIAYRFPSWVDLLANHQLSRIATNGGGNAWLILFNMAGTITVESRTSAGATVTLNATDLEWVADGRWHRVVAKWDDTTDKLCAFHSTRTGGVKSAITAAQTTIRTLAGGAQDWWTGDPSALLDPPRYVDIAQIALALDANVPTDAEILDRMKRPLTVDEIADCEVYISIDAQGVVVTDLPDKSGNGHTAEVEDGGGTAAAYNPWVPSFEGPAELAGQAKPVAFGRVLNAPVTWSTREEGIGVLHSRCIKGAVAAFEGAERLSIGWAKQKFYGVVFDAATDTITLPLRTGVGGADRLDAQPGFSGPVIGQRVLVAGTSSNDGTWTLDVDATERVLNVTGALTNETTDCYLTGLAASGETLDVTLWHEAGGIVFTAVPTLPATVELLGDIGAEIPTDDSATHFPEYAPAIMRTILRDWGGIPTGDISSNWDDGTTTPDNPAGAYFSPAGVWLDGGKDRTIRDVLDEGGDTVWARWGQALNGDTWDLFVIEAPSGTADIDLDSLSILGLRRIRSVPPIGGLTLRAAMNYRVLEEGEVAGVTQDSDQGQADAAALRREFLDGSAIPDSAVAVAYPFAETPEPIETWLRNQEEARLEAQRRYDVLKVEREMYDAECILYGLDQNPLNALETLTDADFGTLTAGKDFWMVHFQANDEATTLTGWG